VARRRSRGVPSEVRLEVERARVLEGAHRPERVLEPGPLDRAELAGRPRSAPAPPRRRSAAAAAAAAPRGTGTPPPPPRRPPRRGSPRSRRPRGARACSAAAADLEPVAAREEDDRRDPVRLEVHRGRPLSRSTREAGGGSRGRPSRGSGGRGACGGPSQHRVEGGEVEPARHAPEVEEDAGVEQRVGRGRVDEAANRAAHSESGPSTPAPCSRPRSAGTRPPRDRRSPAPRRRRTRPRPPAPRRPRGRGRCPGR